MGEPGLTFLFGFHGQVRKSHAEVRLVAAMHSQLVALAAGRSGESGYSLQSRTRKFAVDHEDSCDGGLAEFGNRVRISTILASLLCDVFIFSW